jgi:hypothetical protein
MGRVYAAGLARTTFPSRQMGEMAAGIIHEPGTDGITSLSYRKRPVVIEAFCWTGDIDQTEDPIWIVEAIKAGYVRFEDGAILIDTLEGTMRGDSGDWIIRGVKGEIYPCKPDIFAASYEKVETIDMTDFPEGGSTPLYQISGPNLGTLQTTLDAVAEGREVSPADAVAGLKIIAEAIAERDGGLMVGGALCNVGRPEGAEVEKEPIERMIGHQDEREESETIRQGGGLVGGEAAERAGAGEAELKERPEAPAPEATYHREQHPDGPVRAFEIGQGFVRGSDRDPAGPKE